IPKWADVLPELFALSQDPFSRMTSSNTCQQAPDSFCELIAGSNKADHQMSIRSKVVKMARLHQHPNLAQQGDGEVLVRAHHWDPQYGIPSALDFQPATEFLRG